MNDTWDTGFKRALTVLKYPLASCIWIAAVPRIVVVSIELTLEVITGSARVELLGDEFCWSKNIVLWYLNWAISLHLSTSICRAMMLWQYLFLSAWSDGVCVCDADACACVCEIWDSLDACVYVSSLPPVAVTSLCDSSSSVDDVLSLQPEFKCKLKDFRQILLLKFDLILKRCDVGTLTYYIIL